MLCVTHCPETLWLNSYQIAELHLAMKFICLLPSNCGSHTAL